MITKLQASFSGYQGKPATIFSVYDDESMILAISIEKEFTREAQPDCVIITNDSLQDYDVLFGEKQILEAIESYYAMVKGVAADGVTKRLIFSERAQRADPVTAIEVDGMNESGQRYRISPDMTCSQMAVMATAWYANKKGGLFERAMAFNDELKADDIANKVIEGQIWNI